MGGKCGKSGQEPVACFPRGGMDSGSKMAWLVRIILAGSGAWDYFQLSGPRAWADEGRWIVACRVGAP